MSFRTNRAWHGPLVLLAAASVVAATLWVMGAQDRALADTSSGLTIGNCTLPGLSTGSNGLPELTPASCTLPGLPTTGTGTLPGLPTTGTGTLPGLPTTGTGTSTSGQGTAQTTTLPGNLTTGSYTNSSGTLSYELYVPSTYAAGTAVPLVVALHGCTETADIYRQLSGWDSEAQAENYIVLFPQQSSSRNSESCWNWFVQADMQRGSGEPSIIAGMVNSVEQHYSVDTNRVYVAGFSAGGAMANVMAATYPDMFAAVGVGSGCEYNGLPCVGSPGPPASQTGQQSYEAMGSYARVMPAIVFQGDSDDIVSPANGPLIVNEWQVTDNYALDGSATGSIPTTPLSTTNGTSSGGQSYTVTKYGDQNGNDLIDYWVIHGMNHAWSGGSSSESYSDPSGPSETAAMWAFFSNHPMP
jgi:poly(hydroxyalkanoate) depolymerase family esterase